MACSRETERIPIEAQNPVFPAIRFHVLQAEMIFQKNVNEFVFICNFLRNQLKSFVRLMAKIHGDNPVSQGRMASAPETGGGQMMHVISDPDRVRPDLKAGEDHGQVHHRLSDRSRGVDPVLDSDKFNLMLFQERIERAEIHHVRTHTIYFVDDHAADQAGRDVFFQLIHPWPVHLRPYISVILVKCYGGNVREPVFNVIFADRKLHLSAFRRICKIRLAAVYSKIHVYLLSGINAGKLAGPRRSCYNMFADMSICLMGPWRKLGLFFICFHFHSFSNRASLVIFVLTIIPIVLFAV